VDWNPDEVQDGIYHAVDGAFGWITRFFEKHGSTARSQNVVTRREPARATGHKPLPAFPAVTFYTGTAELTGVSQAGLETLAAEFSAQPDLGVLEVQARVDSLGPEAFNYILTEARAAAVRDFLISAGVPAERIQARGVGSSVLDAPKENSDVQFVVRR
jgi:outer membrane protein OmpA-like peptidoglycan-associated protein